MKLSDLATIQWEKMAEILRSHNIAEDDIRKSGLSYKQGFAEGFIAGSELEEREPCIGFEAKEDDDEAEEM